MSVRLVGVGLGKQTWWTEKKQIQRTRWFLSKSDQSWQRLSKSTGFIKSESAGSTCFWKNWMNFYTLGSYDDEAI
jgi:hypothetical protein